MIFCLFLSIKQLIAKFYLTTCEKYRMLIYQRNLYIFHLVKLVITTIAENISFSFFELNQTKQNNITTLLKNCQVF